MSKFIGLNRVCVPLSLDCDLSCRYCYRAAGRIPVVPDFNDLMREYLGQLDPTKTQALVASGGEPLLHWDKVLELFSYAPKKQHKKVMTNGLNLTREHVKYFNDNNIEVYVSHDGDVTEWLRGVDVLRDPDLLSLIRDIEHLTICCACTAKNPDPYKNYLQSKALLGRRIWFHYNAVFVEKFLHPELVEGFDYKAWQAGALRCEMEDLDWHNPIPYGYKGTGCNVLPNGDLTGMENIHHKYGTVLSTREEILAKQREFGDLKACDNTDCWMHQHCTNQGQNRSDHFCAARLGKATARAFIKLREREDDVTEICL